MNSWISRIFSPVYETLIRVAQIVELLTEKTFLLIIKSNPFPGNWISKIEKMFQIQFAVNWIKLGYSQNQHDLLIHFQFWEFKKITHRKKLWRSIISEFNLTINQFSSKNSSQFTPSLLMTILMISPATTVSPLALVSSSKSGKINRFQIIWNFSWKTAQDTTTSMTPKVMQMHHFHSFR